MEKELISIVVPVYCEEENIIEFHNQLLNAIGGRDYDYEIIFVNDGSSDNSLEILKNLTAKDSAIKVINFSKNSGSYAAIEAGFTWSKGDAVAAISCDLQDPPSLIDQFVSKWRGGNDIVWGVRSGREDPIFKRIFAKYFYWMFRKIAFPDFPTDGMDCGLFDRRIIDYYLKLEDKHTIPFVTIYSMGFKQFRVPYHRKKRKLGVSGWPFWKRVKYAIDVSIGFSYFPIRLITAFGLFCALMGFLYAAIIIGLKIFFGIGGPGWSSLAVLILFIGGIQMIFLGILAEYIWRISDKVKNIPAYYIMEKFGFEEQSKDQRKKDKA